MRLGWPLACVSGGLVARGMFGSDGGVGWCWLVSALVSGGVAGVSGDCGLAGEDGSVAAPADGAGWLVGFGCAALSLCLGCAVAGAHGMGDRVTASWVDFTSESSCFALYTLCLVVGWTLICGGVWVGVGWLWRCG